MRSFFNGPCILGGYASRRFFAGRRGFYHCCAFWVGTRPAVFTGRGGREKTAGRVPTQKARPGKKATRPRDNRARRQKQRDAYPPRMQGLITNAIFRFAVVFYWPLHSGWVCVPPFFAGRRGFYYCCAFWDGTRPVVFTGRLDIDQCLRTNDF